MDDFKLSDAAKILYDNLFDLYISEKKEKENYATRTRAMANKLEGFVNDDLPGGWCWDRLISNVGAVVEDMYVAADRWEDAHPLVVCPECNGKGLVPHDCSMYKCIPESCNGSKCPTCGGFGKVRS